MSGSSGDDYALTRVPAHARKHWFGIAVQRFGQISALVQFLVGATLGYSMSFADAALAILIGTVLLEVIVCLVGIIGQKEGLNAAVLVRWTGLGRVGASVLSLMIGLSLVGWFGVQSAISAESLEALLPGVMPQWAWCLLFGAVVTLIVVFGFKGMQLIANVTVPLFLVLVAWSITSELMSHDLMELVTSPPPGPPMSIWAGAGIITGAMIIGSVVTPDMTRFNRSAADVVKQTVLGVTMGEFLIGLAGVLLAHATGSGNVVAIVTSSVGVVGLIIVMTGTLKINDWNLYSASLAVVAFFQVVFRRNVSRRTATLALGALGSILAALGILGFFQQFLILLGVAFPPVVGIIVAEYYVVRRWRADLEQGREEGTVPPTEPRFVPASLVIWAISIALGLIIPTPLPALVALASAFVLYVLAGRLGFLPAAETKAAPSYVDVAE